MRKTYRSKKDTAGALDHRDAKLTTDPKSSLFDAFYIQNIKQTKRNTSVSSIQFAASNKVRKRKYVKRVKEKTPPPIESMSSFTYLTPDKSLHVNRAPDLFDQVFNSSPADIKKEVCKKIQEKRCYNGVIRKNKKITCWSSDSSDSDKENTNTGENTSDIKSHNLIIEKENILKPIDKSINNMVINLSAFKLDNNMSPINVVESPILSNAKNKSVSKASPSCSTPFKAKYRGMSIYQFSPIAINLDNSSNVQRNLNKSQESIETVNKEGTIKDHKDCINELIHKDNNVISIVFNDTEKSTSHISKYTQSLPADDTQSIVEEPFLGFPNISLENIDSNDNNKRSSCNLNINNTCKPGEVLGSSKIEQDSDLEEDNGIPSTNATNNSIHDTSDDESLYDTCSSEESDQSKMNVRSKEPIIVLNKLNNSIFENYYKKMPVYNLEVAHDNNSNSYKSTQTDNSSHSIEDDDIAEAISDEETKIQVYIDDVSNDSEDSVNELNEDENCVSFVTTRKRNKITNDFSILTLDNSFKSENTSIVDSDNEFISENIESKNCTIRDKEKIIGDNNIYKNVKTDLIKASKKLSLDESEDMKPGIVLQPGKKWERSLSIYRRMTMVDHFDQSILDKENLKYKGRKYRESVMCTMELQRARGHHDVSMANRRSTFACRPSIKIMKESDALSRLSICSTDIHEDLNGFLNEDCDDTVIELSNLSIADCDPEVTVIDNTNDTSHRVVTAREYVLKRCDQNDAILFDECYPDTVLKNCRKIGEGVYGEVFLWRARDGCARVLKVIPVNGSVKVNGETQKGYGEIISEIVIAMELSALRSPIATILQQLDEEIDIETLDLNSVVNATDVFNELLAVRCVYGNYPTRLLDLWDLYDECKGSDNDNPAGLPVDQQFIVLELANAGEDLECFQFTNAEQAYSVFKQVAYGLAVAEETFQFEHRDLHWGNVLVAPTGRARAVFVLRGRAHVLRSCGVRATVIDYSLSRLALRPPRGAPLALYQDLAAEEELFSGRGDYQFELYRLMRRALRNNWEEYEPYTNVLWLHYIADKMITAVRYTRPATNVHKQYIAKLGIVKEQLLSYRSATELVLTYNEL